MSIYTSDWRETPPGYYADPETRARHDRRVRDDRRWARRVEIELGKMGVGRDQIPTREEIDRAETAARRHY